MRDSEIVELHNESLRDKAAQASEKKQVAVEVPLGSTQIEYFARCDQWVPRGSVLRCLIRDDLHLSDEASRLMQEAYQQTQELQKIAEQKLPPP